MNFGHGSFAEARRDWHNEVDREAADLVRKGVPPFDAIERARDIVSARRKRAARRTLESQEGER